MSTTQDIVSLQGTSWIEQNIYRVECIHFAPSKRDPEKCGCGRKLDQHRFLDFGNLKPLPTNRKKPRWKLETHTQLLRTNAHGIIDFQSGLHPSKARYLRLNAETKPEDLQHVLFHEWEMVVPNLVITVLGGLADFHLQPRLKQVFQAGLVKAATTTGAWVISHGLDIGASKYVGEAMSEHFKYCDHQVITLGFAPWGIIHNRDQLIGKDIICPYWSVPSESKHETVLNKGYTHFLLCDDGTHEKFGCDLQLRRRFEQFMAQQFLDSTMGKHGGRKSQIPIVAVLLEGGPQTFATVFHLITDARPVPVVVCDGSGRAADVLSFAHKYSDDNGCLSPQVREQLVAIMIRSFKVKHEVAEELYNEMELCLRRKDLISIFRMDDDNNSHIDIAILTALLHATQDKLSPAEELSLTMAWNRVDIARNNVFTFDRIWQSDVLCNAMFDALVNDRLDFVKLLLKKGVRMSTFLTKTRLESLYNTVEIISNARFLKLLYDIIGKREKFSLRLVGLFIEKVMGSGYRHAYCKKYSKANFCNRQKIAREQQQEDSEKSEDDCGKDVFEFPFNELMQWALLTRRYSLARYMMLSGEESIPKALMAVRLCKGIRECIVKELLPEYHNELKHWQKKFECDAVALQDICYSMDKTQAMRLLTYELKTFSKHTCLSLAYLCESKLFLSHACTQSILNELWYGGLRQCRLIDCRVVFSLCLTCSFVCLPLLIYLVQSHRLLKFKTRSQIRNLPKTLDDYLTEANNNNNASVKTNINNCSGSGNNYFQQDHIQHHSAADKTLFNQILYRRQQQQRQQQQEEEEEASQNHQATTKESFNNKDDAEISHVSLNIGSKMDDKKSDSPRVTFYTGNCAISTNEMHNVSSSLFQSGIGRDFCHDPPPATLYTTVLVNPNDPYKNPSGVTTYNNIIKPIIRESNFSNKYYNPTVSSILDELTLREKISEFLRAPATRYNLHFMFYLLFLACFIFTSSVFIPNKRLHWTEIIVHMYIYVFFIEKFRELYNVVHTATLHRFLHLWNIFELVVCCLSITTMIFRYLSMNQPYFYSDTRAAWSFCCSLWVLRVLQLMQILVSMGTTIYMTREMIIHMMPLMMLLFVILITFGIVRQGIIESGNHTSFGMNTVKELLMMPYFTLFGKEYVEEFDPENWGKDLRENTFAFLVPTTMSAYLLLGCLLITSVIIARFDEIYTWVREQSELVYKYLRYSCILGYESMPLLPPPLTVFNWIYSIGKFCCKRKSDRGISSGLKLFLSPDEIQRLYRLQEEAVHRYTRSQEKKRQEDRQKTLLAISESVKIISDRMERIPQSQAANKVTLLSEVQQLDNKLHNSLTNMRMDMIHINDENRDLRTKIDTMSTSLTNLEKIITSIHAKVIGPLPLLSSPPSPEVVVIQDDNSHSPSHSTSLSSHEHALSETTMQTRHSSISSSSAFVLPSHRRRLMSESNVGIHPHPHHPHSVISSPLEAVLMQESRPHLCVPHPHVDYLSICDEVDISTLKQESSSTSSSSSDSCNFINNSDLDNNTEDERKYELLLAEQVERKRLGSLMIQSFRRLSTSIVPMKLLAGADDDGGVNNAIHAANAATSTTLPRTMSDSFFGCRLRKRSTAMFEIQVEEAEDCQQSNTESEISCLKL